MTNKAETDTQTHTSADNMSLCDNLITGQTCINVIYDTVKHLHTLA